MSRGPGKPAAKQRRSTCPLRARSAGTKGLSAVANGNQQMDTNLRLTWPLVASSSGPTSTSIVDCASANSANQSWHPGNKKSGGEAKCLVR